MLGLACDRCAFRQLGRLADQTVELGIRGQVSEGCDLAELAHRVGIGTFAAQFLTAPEVERHMRFERRGDKHDFAGQRVRRHVPFHRFLDIGQHGVDSLADMFEDRAREWLGLGE